jgi:di/tricarboxylate transporter
MTLPQLLSFAIIAATMALFVWGRLRYDLVALISLLAAIATGIVPPDKAFAGFSDDIVIIVACALLVSAAVGRSGVIEDALARIAPYLTTRTIQVAVLVGTVTALSAFVKNIGALAMLMPVAFSLARKTNGTPSIYLMPMAFGSLLGGIVTPFGMFDFTPVGIGLAVAGVVFLSLAWRLLPRDRKAASGMDAAFTREGYTTEASVPEKSPVVGKTVGEIEAMAEGVEVFMLVRGRSRRLTPSDGTKVQASDILLIEGEPAALDRLVDKAGLNLAREDAEKSEKAADTPTDEIGVMEAVVSDDSPLIGRTPTQERIDERHGVHVLAVSRRGKRIAQRMRAVRFESGDVIVLRGNLATLPETLGELRCLPLAARDLRLGRGGRSMLPLSILVLAMAFVAANVIPVAIAFFAAAVAMLLIRALTLREAYEAVDWPILVMLGALIPVSESLRTTGGTDLIAGLLSAAAHNLPPLGALALIMVAAMAVTPFLNNAATVLVMAPIAASFAKTLGYNPDPFLMAIAIGAACDFLTPVGHQCNTLVMGPGGYRFGDYWRLGLPLSTMVVLAGVPLIALAWPLKGG